jgi:very-short-patch-repair endonuclease
MVVDYFKSIPAARVRTFVCADVAEQLAAIELAQISEASDKQKIVAQTFKSLPDLDAVIWEMLTALSQVALSLWPDWYAQKIDLKHVAESEWKIMSYSSALTLAAAHFDRAISIPWLKAAMKKCLLGKPPLFHHLPHAVQAAQLAKAIEPEHLVLGMASEDVDPAANRLFCLARAAEWYAKETGTPVAVLVPEVVASNKELESILYGAITLAPTLHPINTNTVAEEHKSLCWPINGVPHPFSPGEQALAGRLARDPELAGLFEFNQKVTTVRASRYLVDLLWPAGKIIVEIDGYKYHGNRAAFSQDRHRDYELVISGYTVLRLPHDEVVGDVMLAVEKIRDIVRFRRRHFDSQPEVIA